MGGFGGRNARNKRHRRLAERALRERWAIPPAKDFRLNFRLPSNLKELIQEAAESLGQSVSDFAVSTLVQQARSVIE